MADAADDDLVDYDDDDVVDTNAADDKDAKKGHYGGIHAPESARMVAVTPNSMELEVDGSSLQIPFDHTLTDSEDAHRTLVAMLRAMPKT